MRAERATAVENERDAGRLTPATLSDALNDVVDESTVNVEDAVTSRSVILRNLMMAESESYFWKDGAGLGWAGGAGIGVKVVRPDAHVVSLVGDSSYLSHIRPHPRGWPKSTTLTVVYNNQGWNAVRGATVRQHPDGLASDKGVPESQFGTVPDLSAPAKSVGAFTRTVEELTELTDALAEATAAVDDGTPAVVEVCIES